MFISYSGAVWKAPVEYIDSWLIVPHLNIDLWFVSRNNNRKSTSLAIWDACLKQKQIKQLSKNHQQLASVILNTENVLSKRCSTRQLYFLVHQADFLNDNFGVPEVEVGSCICQEGIVANEEEPNGTPFLRFNNSGIFWLLQCWPISNNTERPAELPLPKPHNSGKLNNRPPTPQIWPGCWEN